MLNNSEPLDQRVISKKYTTVEQIKQAKLKPHRQALEIACLHIESDLYKAVEALEESCDSGNQEATIHFALGDILIMAGGDSLVKARKCYEKAIKLATASMDYQVVVGATAGLAKIEAVLGKTEEADKLLQDAKEKFNSLRNEEKWEELEAKLTTSIGNERSLLFSSNCGECSIDGEDGRFSGRPARCKRC